MMLQDTPLERALLHIGYDYVPLHYHVALTARTPRKVPIASVPAIPNAENIVIIEVAGAHLNDWVEIDLTQTDPKQLASYRNRVQHLINRTAAKYDREKRLAEGATVILPPAPHHPHRRNRHKSTSKHE